MSTSIYLYGDGSASAPASATPTFNTTNPTFFSRTDTTVTYNAMITNYSTLNALAGATWDAPVVSAGTASRTDATIAVTVPIGFTGTLDISIGFTETGKTKSFGYKSAVGSVEVTATPVLNAPSTFTSRTDIAQTYNVPITNYTGNYDSATTWVFTGLTGGVTGAYNSANQRLEITVPAGFNGTVAFTAKATATGKAQSADSNTATTNASPAVSATPTITGGTTVTEGSSLTLNVTPVSGASYAWSANEGSITPSGASAMWSPANTGSPRTATITCRVTEVGKLQSAPDTHDVAVTVDFLAMDGLLAFFDASDTTATSTKIDQTFTPSQVDLGTGTLGFALPLDYFVPDLETAGDGQLAVPLYFDNTGGVLPTPLQVDTPYYGKKNSAGTGTILYPVNTTQDITGLIKFHPDEFVPKGQNFYQDVTPIVLTSQGTGTHRVYTNDLLGLIPNKKSLNVSLGSTTANLNNRVELIPASDGKNGITFEGNLAKVTSARSINQKGIGKKIQLNFASTTVQNEYRESFRFKDFTYSGMIAYLDDAIIFDPIKNILAPTDVDITTGIISYTYVHGFPIGTNGITEVRNIALPGGALPGGMPERTFVRGLTTGSDSQATKGTYTHHATYGDAVANTNKLTYTNAGSGQFMTYAYNDYAQKPEECYALSVEYTQDNTAGSVNGSVGAGQREQNLTWNTGWLAAPSPQGCTNAQISGGLTLASNNSIAGILTTGNTLIGAKISSKMPLKSYPVKLRMHPKAIAPTRTDTGERLAQNTTFYAVPVFGSSSDRVWLFDYKTDADAWAAVPGLNSSMKPLKATYPFLSRDAIVLDNTQTNMTADPNATPNAGFYGRLFWYVGSADGYQMTNIGQSNIVPTFSRANLVPLRKRISLTRIISHNDISTSALRACSVFLTSVTVGQTYTLTVNTTTVNYTALAGDTTTVVLDQLSSLLSVTNVADARATSQRMDIYTTNKDITFSISASSNLSVRPFKRYKTLLNGVDMHGWEYFDNSDIRYAEPVNGLYALTSGTAFYGSPAQVHVSAMFNMFCTWIGACNTDPTTQLQTLFLPALHTQYNIT